jgi:hypothetical protein
VKLQRLRDGKLYLLADDSPSRIGVHAAGPFEDRYAAYLWMIEKAESGLSDEQRRLWSRCLESAGGAKADLAHLLAIIGLIKRNRPEWFVTKCSQPLYG